MRPSIPKSMKRAIVVTAMVAATCVAVLEHRQPHRLHRFRPPTPTMSFKHGTGTAITIRTTGTIIIGIIGTGVITTGITGREAKLGRQTGRHLSQKTAPIAPLPACGIDIPLGNV